MDNKKIYNIGNSNQPWAIKYGLNFFDGIILNSLLSTQAGEARKKDFKKIIKLCKERIKQIDNEKALIGGANVTIHNDDLNGDKKKAGIPNENGFNIIQVAEKSKGNCSGCLCLNLKEGKCSLPATHSQRKDCTRNKTIYIYA